MAQSVNPAGVEHIFAFNSDDRVSAYHPEVSAGVAGERLPGRVTAVRNWNAAAERSSGNLLFVIADDLLPPPDWDQQLLTIIRDLDPIRTPFVVKVLDSEVFGDSLIRHPVVSRCYFQRFGLFYSGYEGLVADVDFTLDAHRRGMVVDGRSLALDHRHPSRGAGASASHVLMENAAARRIGEELLAQRWPLWKRHLRRSYFPMRAGQASVGSVQMAWRGLGSRIGYVGGLLRAPARGAAKAVLRR